jgi:hypothetical protein
MQVIGQNHPGVDPERPVRPHTAHGIPQPVNLPHQQV